MLEMRHSFNNALTSVLGNSELLLLEPGALSAQARDQVDTIHTMSLRLREVMQRFSSLENEMRFSEKQSQAETPEADAALVSNA
jgi:signal transduction histidine kinase